MPKYAPTAEEVPNPEELLEEEAPEDPHGGYDEDGFRIRPNKTVLKKLANEQQDALLELALLSAGERKGLTLSEEANAVLDKIASMKASGARKREIRFAGKTMEEFELDNIRKLLSDSKIVQQQNIAREHTIEAWRDRLITDNSALTELMNEFPAAHAENQTLRQLLRQANKEQQHNKPPAAARKLFKLLREIMQ